MTKLIAPDAYWTMTQEAIDEITGGCGPGAIGDKFVPDTIWGLNIFQTCRIHDFEWHLAETAEDYRRADLNFLGNMIILIYAESANGFMRFMRCHRAVTYFVAVREASMRKGEWL